jgi:hypothetical protein
MNVKKILLAVLIIIVLGAAYAWFFVYNKPHDNIDEIKAKYKIEAADFVKEFEEGYDTSWKKYNEQVLDIKGTVGEVIPNDSISTVVFNVSDNYDIYFEFYPHHNEAAKSLKKDDKITIHGKFLGAEKPDEDFGLVGLLRLKKCSILNK